MEKREECRVILPGACAGDSAEALLPEVEVEARHPGAAVYQLLGVLVELLVESPAHWQQDHRRDGEAEEPARLEQAAPIATQQQVGADGEAWSDQANRALGQHGEAGKHSGEEEVFEPSRRHVLGDLPHRAHGQAHQQRVGAHVVAHEHGTDARRENERGIARRGLRVKEEREPVHRVDAATGGEQRHQLVGPVVQAEQGERRSG